MTATLIHAQPINSLAVSFAFLALIAGFCLLWKGGRLLFRRWTAGRPVSGIAEASLGSVTVTGAADGPATIPAPITGKPCYLYRTIVWQESKSASHVWEKVAEETFHVPFFLEDSSGRLLIEPLGADLDLEGTFRAEFGESLLFDQSAIPVPVSLFLARRGVSTARRVLVEESCIQPGDTLFVIGTLTENPGIEVAPPLPEKTGTAEHSSATGLAPTESARPEIIRLSQPSSTDVTTQQSRIAAALLKAGIQNPHAWEAAGVPYPGAAAIAAESIELADDQSEPFSGFDVKPPFVLMKGLSDTAFLITSRPPSPAPTPWKSAFLLGSGALLAAIGLYLLEIHLL